MDVSLLHPKISLECMMTKKRFNKMARIEDRVLYLDTQLLCRQKDGTARYFDTMQKYSEHGNHRHNLRDISVVMANILLRK